MVFFVNFLKMYTNIHIVNNRFKLDYGISIKSMKYMKVNSLNNICPNNKYD